MPKFIICKHKKSQVVDKLRKFGYNCDMLTTDGYYNHMNSSNSVNTESFKEFMQHNVVAAFDNKIVFLISESKFQTNKLYDLFKSSTPVTILEEDEFLELPLRVTTSELRESIFSSVSEEMKANLERDLNKLMNLIVENREQFSLVYGLYDLSYNTTTYLMMVITQLTDLGYGVEQSTQENTPRLIITW
jgi:hypothetical protein